MRATDTTPNRDADAVRPDSVPQLLNDRQVAFVLDVPIEEVRRLPPAPECAIPRSKDCLMLITVDPRDFETTAARMALVLARPQWNERVRLMAPPVFRDGRRAILLTKLCGMIISEPMPRWRLSHILDQLVRFERILPNGRREPWHPKDAWLGRFLGSPYLEWIPPLSWHPEKLRPDGRLPPGWSVVGWPEHLVFTDWTYS